MVIEPLVLRHTGCDRGLGGENGLTVCGRKNLPVGTLTCIRKCVLSTAWHMSIFTWPVWYACVVWNFPRHPVLGIWPTLVIHVALSKWAYLEWRTAYEKSAANRFRIRSPSAEAFYGRRVSFIQLGSGGLAGLAAGACGYLIAPDGKLYGFALGLICGFCLGVFLSSTWLYGVCVLNDFRRILHNETGG